MKPGEMPLAVLTELPDKVYPREMLPAFLECQDDLARAFPRAPLTSSPKEAAIRSRRNGRTW
jgi:hypothetical protein